MGIREVFARNLRRSRYAMGVSQEELADSADLDRTYISSLERGLYSVSIDTLERLAKALKVSEASLLDRSVRSAAIAKRLKQG